MEDEVIAPAASPAVEVGLASEDAAGGGDEARLVALARQDRRAFTALYRRYLKPVYSYFYQQVGSVEDAEDLTATTFSQALGSLERYQEQGRFAAWLFSIARRQLLRHQRGRPWTGQLLPHALAVDAEQEPEAQALSQDELRRLQGLIRALPAEQREALSLRFFAELRTAEVARLMGRSEGAVKMLVHRAVTTLRDHLRGEERR